MSSLRASTIYVSLNTRASFCRALTGPLETTWGSAPSDMEDLAQDLAAVFFGPEAVNVRLSFPERFFSFHNFAIQNAQELIDDTIVNSFKNNLGNKYSSFDDSFFSDYVYDFESPSKPQSKSLILIFPLGVMYTEKAELELIKILNEVANGDGTLYPKMLSFISKSTAIAKQLKRISPSFYSISIAPSYDSLVSILKTDLKALQEDL